MTYALVIIIAALLASDVPLVWVVRHPQAISATARDLSELFDRGVAWPGKFRRGIVYHHRGEARHARREFTEVIEITPAIEAAPSVPALPAARPA